MHTKNTFTPSKKRLLAASIATALIAGQSYAQTALADSNDYEVVEVRGILSSLQKSTALKRDSDGVVDAISAEDIGKFPDTNLAESLQRISGVSIDRSGGEGSKVTVRGMGPDFNLVLLNGRQMPNSGTGRSFNFADIAAETVSGVEVYKTGSATMQSGGIGSVINIVTSKPLGMGDKMVGSIKAAGDEDTSGVTPQLSGLISKVFNDNFGILVSGAYQERDAQTDQLRVSRWNHRSDTIGGLPEGEYYYTPQQSIYGHSDFERTRINGSVVLQYAPIDDLVATLDVQYSDFREDRTTLEGAIWFSGLDSAQGEADANNTVTRMDFTGKGIDFFSTTPRTRNLNKSVGLNVEWLVSDASKLVFAYSHSTSEGQPNKLTNIDSADVQASNLDYSFVIDGDYAAPQFDAADVSQENLVVWQREFRSNNRLDDIDQGRLDYSYDNYNGFELKAGLMYTDQTKSVRNYRAVNDQSFQGYLDVIPDLYPDAASSEKDYHIVSLDNPFVGSSTFLQYDPGVYTGWLDALGYPANYLDMSLLSDWYDITETTASAYLELTSEVEVAGKPLTFVAGVRYEKTNIDSTSLEETITGFDLNTESASDDAYLIKHTNGAQDYTESADYTMVLPNFSIKYEAMEDVILRFAASRSLTRPELTDMKSARSLGDIRPNEIGSGSAGNPGLKPYISDNMDVSAEWYINPYSYISVGAFWKNVDNFIVTKSTTENLAGIINPSTGNEVQYDISRPQNLNAAKVYGYEMAAQHSFGESGFGVMANATIVDSDNPYDPEAENQTFAVTGLSDSANLVLFYEKDGIQGRIAYNWRDEFLQRFGQTVLSTNEPTIVDAYGQIDASASYDLTEYLTVFVEGTNLTGEDTRTHGRYANQMVDVVSGSARYAIGLRGSF